MGLLNLAVMPTSRSIDDLRIHNILVREKGQYHNLIFEECILA